MKDIIRAKVARILNSREIAITAGTVQGVEVGMLFDVLDQKGENICDPDTGEVLGSIERPKVRVKVTQVQDRIAVASTFKKEKVNVGGSGISFADIGMVSRALMPPKYITKYETLKTDEKTWEDLNEEMSYVKSGDPVVQVIEDVDVDVAESNG
jgi:hypothetical protein